MAKEIRVKGANGDVHVLRTNDAGKITQVGTEYNDGKDYSKSSKKW